LTVVEEGQEASSESTQELNGAATTRRPRRPKVSLDEGREIARLYADGSMPTSEIRARFGIGESSLYRIIQQQGTPLRGHSSAAVAPAKQPASGAKTGRKRASSDGRRDSAPLVASRSTGAAAEPVGASAPVRGGGSRRRTSVAEPRTTASPVAIVRAQASSNGTRFRVRYLGERVFEAQSIHDALRQAEALGATEIMAVARADQ
jgi:transposase-like protein